MSYFLDDDVYQIGELKDKLEKILSDQLVSQFSVSQENVDSCQSIFSQANLSARAGGWYNQHFCKGQRHNGKNHKNRKNPNKFHYVQKWFLCYFTFAYY